MWQKVSYEKLPGKAHRVRLLHRLKLFLSPYEFLEIQSLSSQCRWGGTTCLQMEIQLINVNVFVCQKKVSSWFSELLPCLLFLKNNQHKIILMPVRKEMTGPQCSHCHDSRPILNCHVSLSQKCDLSTVNLKFPGAHQGGNLHMKTSAVPFCQKEMTWLEMILFFSFASKSLSSPSFIQPIKTFHFVQLLRPPVCLLEGILAASLSKASQISRFTLLNCCSLT